MFDIFRRQRHQEKRYFMLRGYMKSGTNWLAGLISTHEDIEVFGEFHWQRLIHEMESNFEKHPIYSSQEGYHDYLRDEFEAFVRKSLDKLARPKTRLIGERTPQTIAPIVMRGVPVVNIVRDGRDVLVSRAFHIHNQPKFSKLFNREPELAKDHEEFKKDPWFFNKHPEMLLRNNRLVWESLNSWKTHLESDRTTMEQNPDLKVHTVRYEDLHQNFMGERNKIFDFLEVDPTRSPAQLGSFLSPGFEEKPNEFFRKGVVGDWKNYFNEQTKNWFKNIAGEELVRQGYEDGQDW